MVLLFFDISGGEIFLVLIAVLVIFGPRRIPEMARRVGKVVGEVKRTTNSLKEEIMADAEDVRDAVRKPQEEINTAVTDIVKTTKKQIEEPVKNGLKD